MDKDGEVAQWFRLRLSEEQCMQYAKDDQVQLIGEFEALAVLAAFKTWGARLARKHVVAFIDNEAQSVSS